MKTIYLVDQVFYDFFDSIYQILFFSYIFTQDSDIIEN